MNVLWNIELIRRGSELGSNDVRSVSELVEDTDKKRDAINRVSTVFNFQFI